jgi:hypothetical protein
VVVMADQSVVGATTLTRDEQIARDRAAFVAGDEGGEDSDDSSKAGKPGKTKQRDAELDDDDEREDVAADDEGRRRRGRRFGRRL